MSSQINSQEWCKWLSQINITQEWRKIRNLNYEVSDDGNVRNSISGGLLKQSFTGEYLRVTLRDENGKKCDFLVHILVAESFLKKDGKCVIVDHLDGNKQNNKAENLEWVTYSENSKRWRARNPNFLKVEQYDMDGKQLKVWDSVRELAIELKCTESNIHKCCGGKIKTCKGFKLEYQNKERPAKVSEEELSENYKTLGIINGHDLSKYYISLDGRNIVGQRGKILKILSKTLYEKISLTDSEGIEYPFPIHKLIDVVLNGGDYNSVVDHKDMNKKNNYKENLEGVTTRENVTRALGRSVRRIDTKTGEIAIFRSISLALEALGKNTNQTNGISSVCDEKYGYKTAFGYKWEWEDINNYKKRENLGRKPSKKNTGRPVRRIDIKTGEVTVFGSVSLALKALCKKTIRSGDVRSVCNGKCGHKTAFGYKWEWDETTENLIPNLGRAVKRIDTKTSKVVIFKSISSALEALCKSTRQTTGISGVCDKKSGFKTAFGYKWEWVEDSAVRRSPP
jgi:HNH endonuclease/NUMOD4 motif/NUMOD1 domain